MTENQQTVERFSDLHVWKRHGQRAPHKPLLVLLALARYARGEQRLIPYETVDAELRRLLEDFGPARRSYHPELPFWHLQTDGLWQITASDGGASPFGRDFPHRRAFIRDGVLGGFPEDLYEAIAGDPQLALEIATSVLGAHFPESVHDDILDSVGLDFDGVPRRAAPRDPGFRQAVLRAYGYSCAICGFKAMLDRTVVGLEAAHIKWHQAGGPDSPPNGVALCALHHKLFDRGMLTIDGSRRVQVSERAHGSGLFDHLVLAFDGTPIRPPSRPEYEPADPYLKWHVRQVFQGPARYVPDAPARGG